MPCREKGLSQPEKGPGCRGYYEYFAVAVSDVHLGYDQVDTKEFEDFLNGFVKDKKIENFIVVGDFLDLWRSDRESLLEQQEQKGKSLHILNDLKKKRRNSPVGIGTLWYVVGNHDFSIEELASGRKNFPKFEFVRPECKNSGHYLELRKGKVTFRFIHGHQTRECKNPLYQGLCADFCGLGESVGQAFSLFWRALPSALCVLVIVLALLILFQFFLPWTIMFFVAALGVPMLWLLLQIHKARERRLADQMLLLIKKLPGPLRQKYRDYLDKPPNQRGQPGFHLDESEKKQVIETYDACKESIPQVKKHLDEITEGTFVIASTIPNVSPRDYLVEGHTHEAKGFRTTQHYKNLGCWYRNEPHYCLTIDRNGNCGIFRWATEVEMLRERFDWRCQPP